MLFSYHYLQKQPLVSIRHMDISISSVVVQIKFSLGGMHFKTRALYTHFHIDGFVRLHAHDKFIASRILNDFSRDLRELNPNLHFALIERLSTLENEWNPIPPLVVNVENRHGKGWRHRIFGYRFVVLVPVERIASGVGFRALHVLPKHDIVHCYHLGGLEDLYFHVPNVLRACPNGLVHRNQTENLGQMILHDIPYNSIVIKIPATTHCPEGLFLGNGNAGDGAACPAVLEKSIAKAQGKEILYHFLSQVVVYTIQLIFSENLLQLLRQLIGRLEVVSERFLHDDPRKTVDGHSIALDTFGDGDKDGGRKSKIKHTIVVLFTVFRLTCHLVLPDGLV
mmetsp:Transcript_772/g.2009  ORF Transcript_772/g.2009 Transcript_772/m.2009 type:complete len:338 (-) Transcript_772:553-1566(-)